MATDPRALQRSFMAKLVERIDGWVDTLTGLGDPNRDKRMAGGAYPNVPLLSYSQLTDLYRSDDVAAKIVEKPVEEMFRNGYELQIEGDDEVADELLEYGQVLEIDQNLEDVERWARAFGGALLVCGLNDGQEMSLPLIPERLKSIDYLTPLNRFEVLPFTYYRDPFAPNYGKPETFLINSPEAGFISDAQLFSIPLSVREALNSGKSLEAGVSTEANLTPEQKRAAGLTQTTSLWNRVVHESRVIRLNGVRTTRFIERANQGWGDSVLLRTWEVARDFARSYQAVAGILTDFAQGKYKIKGLTELLGSPQGLSLLQTRFSAIDMSRSTLRAVLMDADGEDFERTQTPVGGIDALLDRFAQRLASAADMPVTVLMGTSPAGLNATGESDIRIWYDRVKFRQKTRLGPALRKFYEWAALVNGKKDATDSLSVVFNPLYQPTDQEKAATRYSVAQADQIYMQNGVLAPPDVARARFGGTEYSMETMVDDETIDQMEQMQDEQDDRDSEKDDVALELQKKKLEEPTTSTIEPKSPNGPKAEGVNVQPGNNPPKEGGGKKGTVGDR